MKAAVQTRLVERAEPAGPSMERYEPLVLVLLAVCLGIVVDRLWPIPLLAWSALVLVSLAAWLSLHWQRRGSAASVALLVAMMGAGAAWHHARWHLFPTSELGLRLAEDSQPVCVEARVVGPPRPIPAPPPNPMATMNLKDRCVVDLRLERIRDGTGWAECSGRARLTVDTEMLPIAAGDRVRVFALARRPAGPKNPGEFDFAAYHRAERRLCLLRAMTPEAVEVLERGTVRSLPNALQRLRQGGNALLWRHLDRPQAGLAAAVLLGLREQVDRTRTEAFMEAGTVHLLAISGLHVGILALAFYAVARMCMRQRRATWLLAAALVVLYALLTDARPPVVRASILVVVVCVGRCLGRPALSFNTLAAAGLMVLALNPVSLFQTGTQLSFLAVATLASCRRLFLRREPSDPLDRLIAHSRSWPSRATRAVGWWFARLWLTSVLIWLVAMPLVALRFHLISLVAVVANPVVWIPIAVALFSGFGVLLFGVVAPPLAAISSRICNLSLGLIEGCVTFASRLPGSHFWTAGPAAWWVALTYTALALALAFPVLRPRWRYTAGMLVVWIAIGVATSAPVTRSVRKAWHDELSLTFLAVGHGCCVLVDLPDGRTLLYDCGRLGDPEASTRAVAQSLWTAGVQRLDMAVISHADADHYNMLPGLLERIAVGVVYVSPFMFDDFPPALEAWKVAVDSAGAPIEQTHAGCRLVDSPGLTVDVLHPAAHRRARSDNANSIVLRIDYAGRTLLLPGDLEEGGLDDLLAQPPVNCDVVMAPHHGSLRSNPAGFSQWSTPEWVMISGGHATREPLRAAYEGAGATVLNTAEHGAIRVTVRADLLLVEHWDGRAWRRAPAR